MTDLIAKAEALTGPDREMDYAIHEYEMRDFFRKHGYRREGDIYVTDTPPFEGAERCAAPAPSAPPSRQRTHRNERGH